MKPRKSAVILLTLSLVLLSAVLLFTSVIDVSVVCFSELKANVGELTGLDDSVLHAYIGLMIFCIAALILNKPFRAIMPWAIVFGVALLNEGIDLLRVSPNFESKFIVNCLSDVFFTIVFPCSFVLIAKINHSLSSYKSNSAVSMVKKSTPSRRPHPRSLPRVPAA